MARYRYRHTLDSEADSAFNAYEQAILGAAFAVAERAHAGQSRDKAEPEWQYITHPIMVYDIMRRLGERDVTVLAAAILHDAIEKHPAFKGDHAALTVALMEELGQQGNNPPVRHNAEAIQGLCLQVTNPQLMGGVDGSGKWGAMGKELTQHDRIKGMSFAAKKIKIADQAASLMCNLTMANEPEKFTPQQEKDFAAKARTLVVGIVESVQQNPEEAQEIAPLATFFGRVMLNAMPLLEASTTKNKEAIRARFDVDRAFSGAPINILPDKVAISRIVEIRPDGKNMQGLAGVGFDRSDKVARYALWVHEDAENEANGIQAKLMQALRRGPDAPSINRTLLMPRQLAFVPNGARNDSGTLRWVRMFDIAPPLNKQLFAQAAVDAGAIPPDAIPQITIARQGKSNSDMQKIIMGESVQIGRG